MQCINNPSCFIYYWLQFQQQISLKMIIHGVAVINSRQDKGMNKCYQTIHIQKLSHGIILYRVIQTKQSRPMKMFSREKFFFLRTTPWHLFQKRILFGFHYHLLTSLLTYPITLPETLGSFKLHTELCYVPKIINYKWENKGYLFPKVTS